MLSTCLLAHWFSTTRQPTKHGALTYKKSTFFNMVDPPKKMIFFFRNPKKWKQMDFLYTDFFLPPLSINCKERSQKHFNHDEPRSLSVFKQTLALFLKVLENFKLNWWRNTTFSDGLFRRKLDNELISPINLLRKLFLCLWYYTITYL